MVSRENTVILVFGVAALLAGYAGRAFAGVSTAVLIGIVLVVGIVVPTLVNGYLERTGER